MAKSKSIIPEFMSNNPNDTFKFLLPLRLKLDFENYGNSHFEVVVKNMDKNEVFLYEMAPELLFTHYALEKPFINGKKAKFHNNKHIDEYNFTIDTSNLTENSTLKLSELLSEKNIVSLVGWKRTYLQKANNINCYYFKQNNLKIIIPYYAVAVYYYYRFSELREAVLNCNLEDLYSSCLCDRDDASIVLKNPRSDEDAAFIHRFACQEVAHKAFDDIGKYVNTYLKYMKEKYPNESIESIPIKAKFPVKEEFRIDTRATRFINEETGEIFYFVHEIINDYSDIGFTKFTKILENNKIDPIIDFDKLPKVDKTDPNNTTEILKVVHASKKYTQKSIQKNRKNSCGSLKNIDISRMEVTKDEIKKILTIYQESFSDEEVDQSLTDSSGNGDKKVRKVVVSSSFEKEQKVTTPPENVYNFDEFNQYMNYLKQQSVIENFQLNEVQKLPEIVIDADINKINPKCIIQGRLRQYITATFKYNGFYVGLLELENAENVSVSTWVIVSNKVVNQTMFDRFISKYLEENLDIQSMKARYEHNDIRFKFTTKNHEKTNNLQQTDLSKWFVGLSGKIKI